MKRAVRYGIGLAAMVLALSFSTAVHATHAAPAPKPAAAPEPHPEIRAALSALKNARAHLQDAAHDFGGHRVDAIKATDAAIEQLQICLKYDK